MLFREAGSLALTSRADPMQSSGKVMNSINSVNLIAVRSLLCTLEQKIAYYGSLAIYTTLPPGYSQNFEK